MTEFTFSPEPMPSLSTPLQASSTDLITERNNNRRRPRRHTIITRPDSAMALLSDIEDDDDNDQEQQETFDRISGILSSLIQEANEAVNGIEQERVHLLNSNKRSSKTPIVFTSSTIITNHNNNDIVPATSTSTSSKIPRPRKLRVSNTPSHQRNGSSSSSTSTSSSNLFSPISTSTSATLLSRSPSPTTLNKKQLFRHHHTVLRPRSCPTIAPRRSSLTPNKQYQHKRNNSNLMLVTDPITESFKRLDTSMALVDSLSRDLATPTTTTTTIKNNSSNGFTFLLLVPLLHIPHSLITMIFDFCFSSNNTTTAANNVQLIRHQQGSFSISSMIFWACVFAVTNLMVDQVAIIPKRYLSTITTKMKTRRMSLPGTYDNTATAVKGNKKSTTTTININKEGVVPVKRTWIPATIQQQYQFRLGSEELPQPQKRRNSI